MKLRVAIHFRDPVAEDFVATLRHAVTEQGHVLLEPGDRSVTCLISDQPDLVARPFLWLRVDPSDGVAALRERLRALTGVLGEVTHRSAREDSDATTLWLSGVRVDMARGLVHRDGAITKLTPIELGMLRRLAQAGGEMVSRQTLEQDVWGYLEGTQSRTVLTTVHRLRKKIERDPGEPAHLLSERAQGYALLMPAPRMTRTAAGPLFGRDAQLAEALAFLRGPGRVLTVTGPGGIGKTRLAVAIAHELSTGRRDVVWCDCAEVRSERELTTAIARAMEIPEVDDRPERSLAFALSARTEPLLVLDDLDRATAPARSLVSHLLSHGVRGLQVLTTSREPLEQAEERLLVLPLLSEEAAVALFASAIEPAAALGPNDQLALREVVAACERLPLAIMLAARIGRVLTLPVLGARLRGGGLTRLKGGSHGRHGTIQDALDVSWELLSEPARGLLAGLASFPGGFDIAAVEALAEPRELALDLLLELCRKSLVECVDRPAVTDAQGFGSRRRYAMLSMVREYAREREPEAQRAAAQWLCAEALRWESDIDGDLASFGATLVRFRDEAANLREMARWALAHDVELAARLIGAISLMWVYLGPFGEGLELLDAVIAVRPSASLHLARAYLLLHMDRHAESIEAARSGLASGPAPLIQGRLQAILISLGQDSSGERAEEDADGQARELATYRLEARARAAWAAGDVALALAGYSESLGIHASLGVARRALGVALNRAIVLADVGDLDEAERALVPLLADASTAGSSFMTLYALQLNAFVHADRGDLNEARAGVQQWVAESKRLGHLGMAARGLTCLAMLQPDRHSFSATLERARAVARVGANSESLAITESLAWLVLAEPGADVRARDLASKLAPVVAAVAGTLLGTVSSGTITSVPIRLARRFVARDDAWRAGSSAPPG